MKYIIQHFHSEPDSNVGSWRNTAFGGDDFDKVKEIAISIAKYNKIHATKVRVLENLLELDCVEHKQIPWELGCPSKCRLLARRTNMYWCGEPITTKCIQDESWYSDYQAVVEIMCVGPNKDHTDFYERLPNGLEQAKEACRKYFRQFPGPQGWQMPDDVRLERWIKSTWLSEEEMRLLDELRKEELNDK